MHTRHLLAHLGSRSDEAVARMARALRPGGILLVEDVDLSQLMVATDDADLQAAVDRLVAGFRAVVAERGGDPSIGRRLPTMLEAAGLADVRVDARLPYQSSAATDSIAVSRLTIAALRPLLLAHGVRADDVDRFVHALTRPDFRARCPRDELCRHMDVRPRHPPLASRLSNS